jgi:5-methylcytosine-specific restriction endonuclease McrA
VHSYSRFHVTDAALLRELDALDARDTTTTADRLAVLAEVDARRLYAPAGYPSMFAWCVEARHYSDDAAYRRIRAARTARRFPAIFPAVAEGRLHLTAVLLLAPFLSRENVDELLMAATHRTRGEIEHLLAQRFPRPDLPTRVQVIGTPRVTAPLTAEPAAAPVSGLALAPVEVPAPELAPAPVGGPVTGLAPEPVRAPASQLAPAPVGTPAPHSRVTPLAPERYGLQLSISGSLHERLRYAQALLRDEIPMAELVDVIAHGVEALIPMLEKRKFAATERPRARRGPVRGRHIPAEVKRRVWKRDQGRCTFVADSGNRCASRTFLEFDHIEPVARGGGSTVENLRLRCRAHNQCEAERAFGSGFMHEIRERARRAAGTQREPPGGVRPLPPRAGP